MPVLIDGHNLIGQMAGLSLDDPNDETELVLHLRSYAARTRKRVVVVFDHGLPGGPSKLSAGPVHVVFAPQSSNADKVILKRIRRHHNPSELTVVSSDREVAQAAQRVGAKVLRAAYFAQGLEQIPDITAPPSFDVAEEPNISEEEVEEWLRLFENQSPED